MVLEATDEEIYELMDIREHHLILAVGGALFFTADFFVAALVRVSWETVYLLAASLAWTVFFLRAGIREGKKIMEAKGCYLQLDPDSLTVRQIEKSGHYEYCQVFLDEIEKIVEGGRRGIPEFYIVVEDNAVKSFLLLDKERRPGRVFWIRSFGYKPESFRKFYQALRWEVPGKVQIAGTGRQEVWDLKKPKKELLLVVVLLICYVVPKIIFAELGVDF